MNNQNDRVSPETKKLWKEIRIVYDAMNHFRLRKRFVDDGNPKLKEYPAADGSNLEDDDLKISWLLHRYVFFLLISNSNYGT